MLPLKVEWCVEKDLKRQQAEREEVCASLRMTNLGKNDLFLTIASGGYGSCSRLFDLQASMRPPHLTTFLSCLM